MVLAWRQSQVSLAQMEAASANYPLLNQETASQLPVMVAATLRG